MILPNPQTTYYPPLMRTPRLGLHLTRVTGNEMTCTALVAPAFVCQARDLEAPPSPGGGNALPSLSDGDGNLERSRPRPAWGQPIVEAMLQPSPPSTGSPAGIPPSTPTLGDRGRFVQQGAAPCARSRAGTRMLWVKVCTDPCPPCAKVLVGGTWLSWAETPGAEVPCLWCDVWVAGSGQ